MLVAGCDVSAASDNQLAGLRAHEIGFVFQSFHLQESMTAVDNVANGMLYTGQPLRSRRAAAESALERVGLGHRLTHRPQQLSGGERQRVAIARAIAKGPMSLSPMSRPETWTRSRARGTGAAHGLASGGATLVLIIAHDEHIAQQFGRRIQMHDGEIVGDDRS